MEYDYIAIAIQDFTVAMKVKDFLLTEMNIEESKIACMDPDAISQELLDTCLNSADMQMKKE